MAASVNRADWTDPEGLIGMAVEGAAFIDAMLNHQGQQQHPVYVTYIQLLNAHRDLLPLCCFAPSPSVQERPHTGCNYLQPHTSIISSRLAALRQWVRACDKHALGAMQLKHMQSNTDLGCCDEIGCVHATTHLCVGVYSSQDHCVGTSRKDGIWH